MRHQAQVPFDQDVPGLQVPLLRKGQVVPLFGLRQGLGEGAGGELKGVQQRAQDEPHGRDHENTSTVTLRSRARPFSRKTGSVLYNGDQNR